MKPFYPRSLFDTLALLPEQQIQCLLAAAAVRVRLDYVKHVSAVCILWQVCHCI